jgi:hypothetical protein
MDVVYERNRKDARPYRCGKHDQIDISLDPSSTFHLGLSTRRMTDKLLNNITSPRPRPVRALQLGNPQPSPCLVARKHRN